MMYNFCVVIPIELYFTRTPIILSKNPLDKANPVILVQSYNKIPLLNSLLMSVPRLTYIGRVVLKTRLCTACKIHKLKLRIFL